MEKATCPQSESGLRTFYSHVAMDVAQRIGCSSPCGDELHFRLHCFVVSLLGVNLMSWRGILFSDSRETLALLAHSGSLVRDVPHPATGSGTVYTYLYPLSIYIGTRNRCRSSSI